ncbi:hypothetical protein L9F63_009872, partial [Diploptera punctata]
FCDFNQHIKELMEPQIRSLLENHKIGRETKLLKHLEKSLELTIWEKTYIQKNKYKAVNFDIPGENNLFSKFIKSTPDGSSEDDVIDDILTNREDTIFTTIREYSIMTKENTSDDKEAYAPSLTTNQPYNQWILQNNEDFDNPQPGASTSQKPTATKKPSKHVIDSVPTNVNAENEPSTPLKSKQNSPGNASRKSSGQSSFSDFFPTPKMVKNTTTNRKPAINS